MGGVASRDSLIWSFIQQTLINSLQVPALAYQKKSPSSKAYRGWVSTMENGTGYLQLSPGSTLYQFCDFMQGFLNSLCLYFLFSKKGMMRVPILPVPGDEWRMHKKNLEESLAH